MKYESFSHGYKWSNVFALLVFWNFVSIFKVVGRWYSFTGPEDNLLKCCFTCMLPVLLFAKFFMIFYFFSWNQPLLSEFEVGAEVNIPRLQNEAKMLGGVLAFVGFYLILKYIGIVELDDDQEGERICGCCGNYDDDNKDNKNAQMELTLLEEE